MKLFLRCITEKFLNQHLLLIVQNFQRIAYFTSFHSPFLGTLLLGSEDLFFKLSGQYFFHITSRCMLNFALIFHHMTILTSITKPDRWFFCRAISKRWSARLIRWNSEGISIFFDCHNIRMTQHPCPSSLSSIVMMRQTDPSLFMSNFHASDKFIRQ